MTALLSTIAPFPAIDSNNSSRLTGTNDARNAQIEGKSKLFVTLRGGLGNQLFAYSLGLELSEKHSLDLVFDTSMLPKRQDSLGGISRFPSELQNFSHEGTLKIGSYQPPGATNVISKLVTLVTKIATSAPVFSSRAGIVLSSNLEAFLADAHLTPRWIPDLVIRGESALKFRSEIQAQVRALKRPSPEFLSLSREIFEIAPIAVHLREGDYQQLQHLYGRGSTDKYLSDALSALGNDGSAEIWVFSDSPEAARGRKFAGTRIRSITPASLPSPIETLLLMSQSRGLVGANSTFSWWAALLAQDDFRVTFPHFTAARHNVVNLCAPTKDTYVFRVE